MKSIAILILAVVSLSMSACGKHPGEDENLPACSTPLNQATAGDHGPAYVFDPDPIASSGNPTLSPQSRHLDDYRSPIVLSRLGGRGVLEGAYVDIRYGQCAGAGFNAFDPHNQFQYSRSDPRFQEAMSYYWGDAYRARLDDIGYLQPATPVRIIAHCMNKDNAFFVRGVDNSGNLVEEVCLGDSVATPGASYADDAVVVVHELEHATTVDTYSLTQELNQFIYDEAGALNEGISDFLALVFTEPDLKPTLDSRVFSRWALGTFIPGVSGSRGAHGCPVYDSTYPNCTNFHADASGFSASNNTVSYAYPDGLGWPYANNFQAPGFVRQAFLSYSSQEQIHNASTLITGALWDVYEVIKTARGGSLDEASRVSTRLVLEAVKHLPKPTVVNRSPVTFREMAASVLSSAPLVGITDSERSSIEAALTARGLVGGTPLPVDWAAVGTGESQTPGIHVLDRPSVLRDWAVQLGGGPAQLALISQGVETGLNGKIDPGEAAAIWFDVKNLADRTAGGALLTITSPDPDLTLLDSHFNWGYDATSGTVQIRYSKINGSAIVAALSSSNPTYHVPTGPNYFLTNKFYSNAPTTAVWVKASPSAAHGKVVNLAVDVEASNAPVTHLTFPVIIQ